MNGTQKENPKKNAFLHFIVFWWFLSAALIYSYSHNTSY